MKKYLFVLAIFAMGFQYSFSQDIENKKDTTGILVHYERQAEFKGGQKALMDFLAANLKYPQKAVKMGIQKKIFVNFIVRKNGQVDSITIRKNTKFDKTQQETAKYKKAVKALENEAIRLVKLTDGKWKPGKMSDEFVDNYFTLPVTFQLKK